MIPDYYRDDKLFRFCSTLILNPASVAAPVPRTKLIECRKFVPASVPVSKVAIVLFLLRNPSMFSTVFTTSLFIVVVLKSFRTNREHVPWSR